MPKDTAIRVRVNTDEKKALAARAAQAGVSMSDYVRLSVQRDLLADLAQAASEAQRQVA